MVEHTCFSYAGSRAAAHSGNHPDTGTGRKVAFYEDDHAAELSCLRRQRNSLLGNIYVGRVKNIVDNIHAAFIEVGDGQLHVITLFMTMMHPIFTTRRKGSSLASGRR